MDAALTRVIRRFFSKCVQLIVQARVPPPPPSGWTGKTDKWFSLENEELLAVKEQLASWRDCDYPAPLILEIFVSGSHLGRKHRVVLVDGAERWATEKPEIVLERWVIEFRQSQGTPADIAVVYKRALVAVRCLFALVRNLPSWGLRQKIIKKTNPLRISYRIIDGTKTISSRGRVGLSRKIGQEQDMQQYAFNPVESPAGTLHLSVSYRPNANFDVDDSENVLSRQLQEPEEELTGSGSSLRPVLSFTRPFKETTARRTSSTTSLKSVRSEAGSLGTPAVPIPTTGGVQTTVSGSAQAASSSSSRFSSSFARKRVGSASSQSSLEPGSLYTGGQTEVNDFLKFVDDTQRRARGAFKDSSSASLDNLSRFQKLVASHAQLSDSINSSRLSPHTSPPPRPLSLTPSPRASLSPHHSPAASPPRGRYQHIPATPSRLSEEFRPSHRTRLGFYDNDDQSLSNSQEKEVDDDLVFAFRV